MSKLTDKHRKCLELLKQNKHSVKEIASAVGYTPDYIYDLMSATKATGVIGQLFKSEYDKIAPHIEDRTSRKVAQLRERIVDKLQQWVNAQKLGDKLTKLSHKQMIDALNALTKAVPLLSVETNIFKTGLTDEDLIYEFRRLSSIAGSAMAQVQADRDAVQEIVKRRKREILRRIEDIL